MKIWSLFLCNLIFITAASADDSQNVVGCTIFKNSGEILKRVPGQICLFLPDGRFLSAQGDDVSLYNSLAEILWKQTFAVHHQMNFIEGETRVVALSANQRKVGVRFVRYDEALIFDLAGNILRRFDFFVHQKEIDQLLPKLLRGRYFSLPGPIEQAGAEYSHANSIYEIPMNKTSARIRAFKKGNIVLNINLMGLIIILDSQLSKILWHISYDALNSKAVHDVQVLENGHFLFYSNEEAGQEQGWSSLKEFDPISKKIVWHYEGTPRESFRSQICGGVQSLKNGHLLYSDDSLQRVSEIARDGRARRSGA